MADEADGVRRSDLDFMVQDMVLEDELGAKLRAAADTIVVGRRTFSHMAAYWSTADGPMAEWINATPKVVLSSDPSYDVSFWRNSQVAAGDGVEAVRQLKAGTGAGVVTFGGASTARALVGAGLVDQYWLKINPVLIGTGGSMFTEVADRRVLTLRSVTRYPTGSVAAIYDASAE